MQVCENIKSLKLKSLKLKSLKLKSLKLKSINNLKEILSKVLKFYK